MQCAITYDQPRHAGRPLVAAGRRWLDTLDRCPLPAGPVQCPRVTAAPASGLPSVTDPIGRLRVPHARHNTINSETDGDTTNMIQNFT